MSHQRIYYLLLGHFILMRLLPLLHSPYFCCWYLAISKVQDDPSHAGHLSQCRRLCCIGGGRTLTHHMDWGWHWYRHISKNVLALMERDFEWAMLKGACAIEDCIYCGGKKLKLQQHAKSHYLYSICPCSYFSAYRDTMTKHGRSRHHRLKSMVM